ncbi:MAG: hypothetical protein GY938_16765 [Ketobacter sp.]|nr:hypothetical protein [Ketobacter sp.]
MQLQKTGMAAQKVAPRDAWEVLRANYSHQDVPPNRWRLLEMAIGRHVPDDILSEAIVIHISESQFFPTVYDLTKIVDRLMAHDVMYRIKKSMLAIGWRFVEDVEEGSEKLMIFQRVEDAQQTTQLYH